VEQHGHRILCGSFKALEGRLFTEIASLQETDPLRPVWVVLGSRLIGVSLRRRYLEWKHEKGAEPGHALIRFLTLDDLASTMRSCAADHHPLAPQSAGFAAAASALLSCPDAGLLGPASAGPAVARAVEATLRDLADSGIDASAFERFAADLPGTPDRRPFREALAQVYRRTEEILAPFETAASRLAAACRAGPPTGAFYPLLFYGFYDATGAQLGLLEAAGRGGPVLFFVPRPPGDLGEYAEPFLSRLENRLGSTRSHLPDEAADCARDYLLSRLGFLSDESPLADDGSFQLMSACDDVSERSEIAREIFRALGDGIPLHKIAVITRDVGPAARALSAGLGRLGIPNFVLRADPAADAPLHEALILWWRLEEEGFRREDVLTCLELLAAEAGEAADASTWRKAALRAGIVRGANHWNRLPDGGLRNLWLALHASAAGWPAEARSLAAWSKELDSRLTRLFSDRRLPLPVSAAIESVVALSPLNGVISRPAVHEVFFESLAASLRSPGQLGRDGVAILPAMAARGLSFDLTIIAGLVENEFPAAGRQDPVLLDEEREDLARRTGKLVPLKLARRSAEERMLFGLAAGSALRRLVLTSSRRDSSLGRERIESSFFGRAMSAAAGEPAPDPLGVPALRRTLLGRPPATDLAVSEREVRESLIASAGAASVAPHFPPLARSLRRLQAQAEPSFTPYDGVLGPGARTMLARHRFDPAAPLSASALERFGNCPLRYFFRQILRLRPLEEPEMPGEITARLLGQLFHEAARSLTADNAGGRFREVLERDFFDLASRAAEETLRRSEENGLRFEPPLFRKLAHRTVKACVLAWLDCEKKRPSIAFPVAAEAGFGPPRSGGTLGVAPPVRWREDPVALEIGRTQLALRGEIDRIDADASGQPIRVIDYKTKKTKWSFPKDRRIAGGEALQLPVYALAAAAPVSSEYLVIEDWESANPKASRREFDAPATEKAIEDFKSALAVLDDAISSGTFVPRTKGILESDLCEFCDFSHVCGPGHIRRFRRKRETDRSSDVRRVISLETLP
jgi:RecB family exonuclease